MSLLQAKSLSESECTQAPETKRGMAGLLQKARQFAGEGEGAPAVNRKTSEEKRSGGSSIFKKIKNAAGFSDQPGGEAVEEFVCPSLSFVSLRTRAQVFQNSL